jgi:hypothetical protein
MAMATSARRYEAALAFWRFTNRGGASTKVEMTNSAQPTCNIEKTHGGTFS